MSSSPPRLLVEAVVKLRGGLRRLADLLVPPQLRMFELIAGVGLTQAIHAAARLRVADHLAERPLDAEELGARTGLPAASLHRLLRGLASVGVFALGRDCRFRNNRLSRTLCSGRFASLRDYAGYFGSASNVHAWADLDRTLAGGESAFARVHGMSVWDWFGAHPEERQEFAGAMVALTELFARGIATAYPFAEVRRLCDVGGGIGTLLAAVLARHPHLQGVLFDSAEVVEAAAPFLAQRGGGARVERVAGSFFASVPAGCDAYILKNILHDWDDERALQILANCRRAMQPGHRLLVVEAVVEKDTIDSFGPLSDLQMMVVCDGGRERGRDEFARLFARSGFRLSRILRTASAMSVIEGIAGD
jgi:hypothetical protein